MVGTNARRVLHNTVVFVSYCKQRHGPSLHTCALAKECKPLGDQPLLGLDERVGLSKSDVQQICDGLGGRQSEPMCTRHQYIIPKRDGKHLPLGGTEIGISRSIKHFEEDQRLSGRNVLDLVKMGPSQIKVWEGMIRERVVRSDRKRPGIRQYHRFEGRKSSKQNHQRRRWPFHVRK